MFRKECWTMYGKGYYGYKNGIEVIQQGKTGHWYLYQYKKLVYIGRTLYDCKMWIDRTNAN